ncbi:esterase/lipase family protein [Nocardioides acrostichi]|uniref:Lipase n=1 Tax=Nocardioides acrostichi TaxID=2784339 RepID=A0A930YCA5_9ACTN|nr:lipase [Nocardioides acrostichi]MBF4161289.1 lipase [Nocardioides acrostichi]
MRSLTLAARGRRLGAVIASVAALAAGALITSAPAQAAATGPAFSAPDSTIDAAVTCDGDLSSSSKTPVLLVPGTTLTPAINFSWNYEKVFSAQGRPWCAVTLPNHAMSDIQVAGEYVARAIRTTYAQAGRRIDVLGFSQGGMVPRWALKYWPDTRAMVDDLVGLDPSNHGTLDAHPICALPGGCAPAFWQQRTGSDFLTALNDGPETWAGISYTQIYTATDEVVVPNVDPAASSALHTGAGAISNVMVQSICPVHVSEHLSMGTSDPVGYALALDAFDHAGPAKASRISRTVCLRDVFPGIDRLAYPANFGKVLATAGEQALTAKRVPAEPELAAYAR